MSSFPHGTCSKGEFGLSKAGPYLVTSSSSNASGSHHCTRYYGNPNLGQVSYHYSNADGSYYYKNPNGSTYYNSGNGYSKFIPADEK